ncbi:Ribonuclease H-like protein [Metarhizium robertsii ARSEF 23]|uniref:Ribonuclease H-like protein n=2 Tax=Metarhizium TaxID=5529 RepID=A0A0B2XHL7_METRA|nr:Ribonuclease H-like protein [Metarhizium robertsii ARSEF 23]KHO11401.1 Ribonuclease H-like protein [Metarhizium robertsii ARSEF 23]KID83886.1 F-box domain-containing protein [Metarhizium guizhouense ARSEF 977]
MRDKMETPSRPKGKKLPFKATVLCKVTSQNVETIHDEKLSAEDDGLDLFRRSKEMEPIIAAELQRSLKKKQRLEDERRQSAKSKRLLDDNIEREVIANAESGTFSQVARSMSPVASELVKDSREIVRLVYICAYLRDVGVMQLTITSKFVTPLASKRMRLDSTLLRNASLDMDNADTTLVA